MLPMQKDRRQAYVLRLKQTFCAFHKQYLFSALNVRNKKLKTDLLGIQNGLPRHAQNNIQTSKKR